MTVNKIVIPSILVVTVLLSGFFAFSPVDEASTVHNILINTLGGLDVYIFLSGPSADPAAADIELIAGPGVVDAGDGTGQIEIDVLVLDANGDGVTGLVVGDFTFTFTARDGGGAITEIDGDFAEVGDGLYTISADGDADLGADGADLAYMITVVVDDADDNVTDDVGTGAAPMTVIITAV